MSLASGARLGRYEILAPIGASVWERYTKPATLDWTALWRSRFQENSSPNDSRVKRAVATLNHSNICTLDDVGPNYLPLHHVFLDKARLRSGWSLIPE
jgi:hypothetical protein